MRTQRNHDSQLQDIAVSFSKYISKTKYNILKNEKLYQRLV